MPSRSTDSVPKNEVHQSQIKELLEYREVIDTKFKSAIAQGLKVRLDDLLEDTTINVGDEYVEDQIRIICNNTGKGNFKQKIEDLKKYVVKKVVKAGDEAKEGDEKTDNAEENLRWFIQYILTKRLGPTSVAL